MPDWTAPVVHPITGNKSPVFLHGVIVPMYTPCNPDHTLDEQGIRAYTDALIDTGAITTLFPRSGLGRMYSFEFDEITRAIDIVTDQAAGRLPVMPGCGGVYRGRRDRPDPALYTRQSIELCQHAQAKGAIAVVLVVPYPVMNGPSPEDAAFDYYRTVASEIDLPVVVYQPPVSRRQHHVSESLLSRLLTVPQVIGMKYTTDRMGVWTELATVIEESDFALIAGDERAFAPAFMLGATGVIGQGASNNPEILRAVYERLMSGDFPGASRAARDAGRAIDITDGIDPVVAGLSYLAYKGKSIQPYTKTETQPIGPARLERFVREMDALRRPYADGPWWERTGS